MAGVKSSDDISRHFINCDEDYSVNAKIKRQMNEMCTEICTEI